MTSIAGPWLLTFLLHSTALALAAIVATSWLDRPAWRAIAARVGLLAGFATASLAVWPGSGPVERASVSLEGALGSVLSVPGTLPGVASSSAQELQPAAAVPGSPGATGAPAAGSDLWGRVQHGWPVAILGISALLALGLGMRELRARGALRGREPLRDGPDDLRLTMSRAVAVPLALGRREVVVPPRFRTLDPHVAAAVLAHERAHIERRDPLWLGLMQLARALAWFQPLAPLLLRRHAAATELAADAQAVGAGGQALELAMALERVASWAGARGVSPVASASMVGRRSVLVERVERLLAPEEGATPRRRGALGLVALTVAAGALACAGPRVTDVDDGPEPETRQDVTEGLAEIPLEPYVGADAEPGEQRATIVLGDDGEWISPALTTEEEREGALRDLASRMRRAPGKGALAGLGDLPTDRLLIEAHGDAPYLSVSQIIAASAQPGVFITKLELGLRQDGALRVEPAFLPTEDDVPPPVEIEEGAELVEDTQVSLSVSMDAEGRVAVKLKNGRIEVENAEGTITASSKEFNLFPPVPTDAYLGSRLVADSVPVYVRRNVPYRAVFAIVVWFARDDVQFLHTSTF